VHGAMDRAASFGRMARHLEAFHVVRYDRRGYSKSRAIGVGTLDDHVDDLLAVIGDRKVVVFGHSIGGVIALLAARRRADLVSSVVAYEAPTPWEDWWPQPEAGAAEPATEAEAFMRRAIGDRYWSRLPARTREDRRAEGQALQADIASIQAAPFVAEDIDVPVLVAAGSATTWWHARAARALAARLPEGEYVEVPDAQHGVHLTHPRASAALVVRAAGRGGLLA